MNKVLSIDSAQKARGLRPQPRKIKAIELRVGKGRRVFPAKSFAFSMNDSGQIVALFLSELPMTEFIKLFRAGMYHEYVSHVFDCATQSIEVKAIFEENR